MRARVSIQKTSSNFLPFDYQYALASMLYEKMGLADPELASKSHGKPGYKFYNFSNFIIQKKVSSASGLDFEDAQFIISSPDGKFLRGYAEGLLSSPEFHLYEERFAVSGIEILPEPEIRTPCRMRTLSPIFVKTLREEVDKEGKTRLVEWDLYPDEGKFYDNLHRNLIARYSEFHGKPPESDCFEITKIHYWKGKRIGIGGGPNKSMRRCSLMDFDLSASIELLKFIYDAGIGEKTGMGFGCVEILGDIDEQNKR